MRPSCSSSRVRRACASRRRCRRRLDRGTGVRGGRRRGFTSGARDCAGGRRNIVGQQWLTKRTVQLTVATPSFTTPALVEVMLPTGYAAGPDRRWPVTHYMHGTNGDQTTFRTGGCHTRAMFRQQIAETLPRFASRFAALPPSSRTPRAGFSSSSTSAPLPATSSTPSAVPATAEAAWSVSSAADRTGDD